MGRIRRIFGFQEELRSRILPSTSTFRCFLPALALLALGLPAIAAPEKPEQEWQTFARPADGFTIDLPATWRSIEMSGSELERALMEISKLNPDLRNFVEAADLPNAGLLFFAIDLQSDVDEVRFVTNVNVLIEELPPGISLETYIDAARQQMEPLDSVTAFKSQKIELADGRPAGRLDYHMGVDSSSKLTMAITQIFAISSKGAVVFTFSTVPQLSAEYRRDFDGMIQRLRVLD